MNTVVNHKSKDILQVSWAENPPAAWQVATAQKHRDSKCDCLGVVSGASNRGAPRGARAQKQTTLASDARPHGERERFSRSSDEASNTTLKAVFFFFAGTGALKNSTGNRPAAPSLCFRFGNQRCERNSQRLGDGVGGVQTWVAQSILDLPNVGLMESGLLSKGLFAQFLRLPVSLQHQGESIREFQFAAAHCLTLQRERLPDG
jgi:hypothetical protein